MRFLGRILRFLGITIGALVLLVAAAFGGLLLWFRPPFAGALHAPLAIAFGVIGLSVSAAFFTRARWRALLLFLPMLFAVAAWWSSITPLNDRDWEPSVARMPTGVIEGDTLTMQNVRHFTWSSLETAAPERWEQRRYALASLVSVDLIMNYWMGPHIAHPQISFGFADGAKLIWSIEVRNLRGQTFDALAGLFRTNELVFVAGDERDIIQRRTHFSNEDVRLYRLTVDPALMRRLLLEYVADANRLAETPRFYNTLTTNCTSVIVKLIRAIKVDVPFDWRLLLNGHLPAYLHERGALAKGYSLEALMEAAAISARARTLPDSPAFSRQIREGIPGIAPVGN
jgi:hypothetical protein